MIMLQKSRLSGKQTGASITELLVVTLAMAPLVLGAIQMAMFYHAKSIINYAAFEAARAGAVSGASMTEMRRAFQRNIMPLYGGGTTVGDVQGAFFRARIDTWLPTIPNSRRGAGGKIEILSPTREVFQDFGIRTNGGPLTLPSDHLRYRVPVVGARSRVSVQDANLLKIKVTYGYKMIVPVINRIIANVMQIMDARNILYYRGDPPRMPIVSYVTVRMQSNTRFSNQFPPLSRAPR